MKQGEIWLIDLDPTVGAEIKKTRPAVIVNDNVLGKLPLRIIVPLTDWKEYYSMTSWMIPIYSFRSKWVNKKIFNRLLSNTFRISNSFIKTNRKYYIC